MNILITSASRKVSLVNDFKSALKKEGGGVVVAADNNPFSASLFFADKHYVLPKDSDKNFLEEIIKICKKENIKLIVPTRDEELAIFSKNKDFIEGVGAKIMVASENTIKICQDKLKFFEFCKKNNIPCPKIYSTKDVINKFPIFLNGRNSKASKNAFKINSRKEFDFYLKIVKKPVIQEFLLGKEYTIDLFSDFEGNIISAVPRERIKVFGGESFVSKTFKNEKIINEAINLANKLKLVGHNTIQCFFDKENVKFIEVNPRYGGGASLSIKAGADTPRLLIKIVKGEKIKPRLGKFKEGLLMLRYTKDFFINDKI